jgi:hypothetical protein
MELPSSFRSLLVIAVVATGASGQTADATRLRALREKARIGTLTADEKTELDKAIKARTEGRTTPPAAGRPATEGRPAVRPADPAAAAERKTTYLARQAESFARMREQGVAALNAAKSRPVPTGPAREIFVNNEIGDDNVSGLAATKSAAGGPLKTLAKAVSLLQPGDTLHLAVTNMPYHESLRLGDNFGGLPGKPIVIDGHGATITGCDPLRLEGWEEAGTPGLYKSAKFLSELEEFSDEAKLGRVFFVFDGVMQHMGRSMKGAKAHFKSPEALQPGEWTYVEADKSFYLKVAGSLAEAKVEAPYRRNGVAVRAPKAALTYVVIKNLIVCRVLNDGFNLHGTTQDLLLQNIAAYECGDDGISPHETCEVTIDGYWAVGNSTGMGNGYLSVTKASNIRLEGNLAHQFMTGHQPVTELKNSIIFANKGTQPINITNSQESRLLLDNVQISSPSGQKVLVVEHSYLDARRVTVLGPSWENAGKVRLTESVLVGGGVKCLEGSTWEGSKNVYDSALQPPPGELNPIQRPLDTDMSKLPRPPFAEAGANPAEFKIPPRPIPHPGAGKINFTAILNPT